MSAWVACWLAWLAVFIAVEVPAAIRKRGGTLSENTWDWFSVKEHKRFWLPRRCILGVFMVVLTAHFLTGGAYLVSSGLAVGITGAPVGAVIVLSSIYERKGDRMGGLLAKLIRPLAIKFLKGNWGKLLPGVFKAAGEGQFGTTVQKVYLWSRGKKTITGAVLLGLGAALETVCSQYPVYGWSCAWSRYVYDAGIFLTSVGLVDGATRSPWPAGTPKEPTAEQVGVKTPAA